MSVQPHVFLNDPPAFSIGPYKISILQNLTVHVSETVPHGQPRNGCNVSDMSCVMLASSCKDNCDGSATSSECHPIVFLTTYCMESLFMARDHKVVRRSASLITYGLDVFMTESNQAAEDRRTRKHATVITTPSGPCYHICNRVCASDFGLRSHLRSHKK